jgi:hypothetical protein
VTQEHRVGEPSRLKLDIPEARHEQKDINHMALNEEGRGKRGKVELVYKSPIGCSDIFVGGGQGIAEIRVESDTDDATLSLLKLLSVDLYSCGM